MLCLKVVLIASLTSYLFWGVNESGAEFGSVSEGNVGVYGTDYSERTSLPQPKQY